ncbi:MAG: methyltransferase domain-containing protein [Syntrophaceae bacterium]|nr:methyltransferase domain-containing protein [Syntrophaceae bacterium]
MEVIFDKYAEVYDKWFITPAGSKVFELELNTLFELIDPSPGMTMLDIGIGTGLFALEFSRRGVTVSGIDPSEKMIAIARKRGLNTIRGEGEHIPFPDNSFDVVLSMTSMEFSGVPDRFVSEMIRVARPSAPIVVAVLNLISPWGIKRRIKGLFKKSMFNSAHFYTFWELKRLLWRHVSSVGVTSSVFINPKPSQFILSRAEAVENFGKRYLTPFGSLLVGKGIKE